MGAGIILDSSLALAAPPPGANRALSGWFESLTQPANGLPCCSIFDCRITRARATPEGYDALIEGEWITIPSGSILYRADNPTGHAVVCYRRYHTENDELLRRSSASCRQSRCRHIDRGVPGDDTWASKGGVWRAREGKQQSGARRCAKSHLRL